MKGNVVEAVLGAVVLMVAAVFVVFVYSTTAVRTVNGYDLLARFDRVDGLAIGSDVRVSGIKVGTVVDQKIDPASYLAVVRFNIDGRVTIPADSSAEIIGDGLLGSKYLSLVPGGDETKLKAGGEVKYTQAPVSLENLIGQLIFSQADDKKKPGADKSAVPAMPTPK